MKNVVLMEEKMSIYATLYALERCKVVSENISRSRCNVGAD